MLGCAAKRVPARRTADASILAHRLRPDQRMEGVVL